MTASIRAASSNDARAIAEVHVASWLCAYRGLIPDDYLDEVARSVDKRASAWRDRLANPSPEQRTWVAELNGKVVGFARTGPTRDADAANVTAEVEALYLSPAAVGQGIGRTLFAHATRDLRDRGYTQATLWVLTSNQRTRRFYKAAGWRSDGTARTEHRPGIELPEVRYRITW